MTDEDIKICIENLYMELEAEDKVHKQVRTEINKEISELRKQCKHSLTTYHPDPSGNNDSCYTCNICGEERKRF